MITTFDKYLLRSFFHVYVILFISTYGLFVVIDGFTNVDGFQRGQSDAMSVVTHMIVYYVYQSSIFFNLTGSILTVIAVMAVLALLLRHSEIYPLLAAGVPTYRLAIPFLVGTVIVSVAVIVNQEFIIPRIAHHLQAPRSEKNSNARQVEAIYDYVSNIYIAGERLNFAQHRMINAAFVLNVPEVVEKLTTLKASEAVYHKGTDEHPAGWQLRNAKPRYDELSLTQRGKKVVRRLSGKSSDDLFILTDVSFDQLYNRSRGAGFASTLDLIRRIKNPAFGSASLPGQMQEVHTRLVQPLINIFSVLLTVPLIVRREKRGLVTNMAVCTFVLGSIYGLSQLCFYMGQVNLIGPDLAAWVPVIFTGTANVWYSGVVQT